MTEDQNFVYVAAAYGFGALVVGVMIVSILLDYAALRRALTRFPQRRGADENER